MSTTVQSRGYFGILVHPIPKDQMEEVLEKLYNEGDGFLKITYDGKLLYSDDYQRKDYSEREFTGDLFVLGKPDHGSNSGDFYTAAVDAGFPVQLSSIQPYNAIWYNGSDSPMSETTIEDFQRKTGIVPA